MDISEKQGTHIWMRTAEGTTVLLDPADYAWVARYTWHDILGGRGRSRHRTFQALVSLPVYLMKPPVGSYVDHINGNPYDCRRSNLRVVTPSQSAMNTRKRSHGPNGKVCSSRFKGISYHRWGNKWQARICFEGRTYQLGEFNSEVEAANAYNVAADRLFGKFARKNVLLAVRHMIVGSRRRERTGHSNCIEAIAQKLKPHQAFEIEWIDASESDVTSVLLPLPDHNVETRHQEIGWFVTLQKGASWRDLHLIYIIRILDADTPTKRYRVESIPLVLAKRIVPLDVKQALKAIKRASAAANTASARPRHHRRHTQRFNDGSVKHVD